MNVTNHNPFISSDKLPRASIMVRGHFGISNGGETKVSRRQKAPPILMMVGNVLQLKLVDLVGDKMLQAIIQFQ
jgi:hypothetical protein